ncbi:putative glycogen debranching enzyme [Balneicella halophila]|uniref:Putative glycogen debranching enzyme n=1 Tax=Balneicella halophila TaxID=1537566 RepID=A0A7L4UNR7_BALHA|nr:glycogen debranching enzyme N-terminal domain-containing protein [Balneicella halophila]PVX49937.1 putative glycogen debranching enzyme [Balneicella halophila]
MPYLKFDKLELVNLQYSTSKELLRTNRSGSYSNTTVSGCNTRKYHGLLVSPIEAFNNSMHVLLSSLDISVIQHEQEFNLGLHKYAGNHYKPKGHKYLKDFSVDTIPLFTFRVGGVVLRLSKILVEKNEQVLVRISLDKAHSKTKIRLKPMLTFRNIHELTKENMHANTRVQPTNNGVIAKLYENYPELYMQTSKKGEFVSIPLWYKDVEYIEEQKRGYAYKEDLFSPGYFELPIEPGETIYFSASLKKKVPSKFESSFDESKNKRVDRGSFLKCLHNAAQQFIRKKGKSIELVAGFPWYDVIPRDTLIAAPTLLFENNDKNNYKSLISNLVDNLELETGEIWGSKQVSVDAPLWLFYSLYQYEQYKSKSNIWKDYRKVIKQILTAYRENQLKHIEYRDNGLLYITNEQLPLTWMNSNINGRAVVKRHGYVVEVCALWYNAIFTAMQWAKKAKDASFIREWAPIAQLIEENFKKTFSDESHSYLADYVTNDYQNFDFRPNQLIAIGLPYTPLEREDILIIKRLVKQELLTPKGVRTLSPQNNMYSKSYEGNHLEREQKAHQGTVYPWLLLFYCEAYLKLHYRSIPGVLQEIIDNFEEDVTVYGIGTINEMYDADPPQTPRGAISMATSVAAILRIYRLREQWMATHTIEE